MPRGGRPMPLWPGPEALPSKGFLWAADTAVERRGVWVRSSGPWILLRRPGPAAGRCRQPANAEINTADEPRRFIRRPAPGAATVRGLWRMPMTFTPPPRATSIDQMISPYHRRSPFMKRICPAGDQISLNRRSSLWRQATVDHELGSGRTSSTIWSVLGGGC